MLYLSHSVRFQSVRRLCETPRKFDDFFGVRMSGSSERGVGASRSD